MVIKGTKYTVLLSKKYYVLNGNAFGRNSWR